ncbi:unnamed protein product [Dicrocoelium dendriticum]|nr:unnamed protein product [Dicrocoelium dendriticum]
MSAASPCGNYVNEGGRTMITVDYYEAMKDTHWNPNFSQLAFKLATELLWRQHSRTGLLADLWSLSTLTPICRPSVDASVLPTGVNISASQALLVAMGIDSCGSNKHKAWKDRHSLAHSPEDTLLTVILRKTVNIATPTFNHLSTIGLPFNFQNTLGLDSTDSPTIALLGENSQLLTFPSQSLCPFPSTLQMFSRSNRLMNISELLKWCISPGQCHTPIWPHPGQLQANIPPYRTHESQCINLSSSGYPNLPIDCAFHTNLYQPNVINQMSNSYNEITPPILNHILHYPLNECNRLSPFESSTSNFLLPYLYPMHCPDLLQWDAADPSVCIFEPFAYFSGSLNATIPIELCSQATLCRVEILVVKDEAKTRFMCPSCARQWTSMKGSITFVVLLSYFAVGPIRVGSWPIQPGANVFFELCPQSCGECDMLCQPKWYPEEIQKPAQISQEVLRNLFVRIHEKFYRNIIPWDDHWDHNRRDGQPTGPHDILKCFACRSGERRGIAPLNHSAGSKSRASVTMSASPVASNLNMDAAGSRMSSPNGQQCCKKRSTIAGSK